MIQPTLSNDSSEQKEVFKFLDDEVEQFEEPEIIDNDLEYSEPGKEYAEDDEENELSNRDKRTRAKKNAKQYVRMASNGFASLAAVYASSDSEDFLLEEEDQSDIAVPLSDVLYESRSMNLPPGWMLIIAVLISFTPLIIKAINTRKDNKALEAANKKIKELEEKKEAEKETKEQETAKEKTIKKE